MPRNKINRPTADDPRNGTRQEWYDLGYSDAEEDCLTSEGDAYDTGYDNGREDGLKELSKQSSTTGTNLQDVKFYRLEERITRIETYLRAKSEVSNWNEITE